MNGNSIYEAIAKRTGGNVYIGVVGPVRTGKSTFISKFMESAVLPAITDEYERERARDEVPQSGSGKTVMTTEPKFVPREAVRLDLGGTQLSVRLVDCVGFMVEGAEGTVEGDEPRMVRTPWSEEPMPFSRAAEIGTQRVVREHSTIAMLVTADGSFTGISREAYLPAEERTISELRAAGVPFAIILNSAHPGDEETAALGRELEERYGAPVALVDATKLTAGDIEAILELVVYQFPIRELCFELPEWYALLDNSHPIIKETLDSVRSFASGARCFGDVMHKSACADGIVCKSADAGTGTAELEIPFDRALYLKTLGESCGIEIGGEAELFSTVRELGEAKREYDRLKDALAEVRQSGWGVVMPSEGELEISEPELVRSGNQWGVRIGARAEAIHMVKTYIRTDVSPAVGTEEQAGEVIKQLSADYEGDPASLLESKLFGKSLCALVHEGMAAKLLHMPPEARSRMGQTVERIINEGASGLICILV